MNRPALRTALLRRRSRGVAMVEAAVMLPMLTAFFGMMTYNFKSLDTRIRADAEVRANISDVAAHNCESGGSGTAALMEMGLGVLDSATSSAGSKLGDQGSAQILGKMVQSAAQTLTADAVTKYGKRTITSSAKMTCNEKPFDGNIGTWFKYAASAFSSVATGGSASFP